MHAFHRPPKSGILEHFSTERAAFVSLRRSSDPMSKPMSETTSAPPSFEAAMAELENIVATMEGGQLPLADSLAAYKRGAELLQYCQAALKDAQQQIQVLERGVLKAFAPDASGPAADDEP
jgi:exodeoxyribonuclease VII small subunit